MKKLLLLFAIALFVTSCEGPMGPAGPAGETGADGYSTNWKIIDFEVKKSDWKENLDNNGLNRYYSYSFNVPEITSTIFNDGTVIAYIKISDAQQILPDVQQTLPYVRHYQTSTTTWTRTVDFEYAVGSASFFVTNSDFAVDAPDTMKFRMVLMW